MRKKLNVLFVAGVVFCLVMGSLSAGYAKNKKPQGIVPPKAPVITGYAEKCAKFNSKLTISGQNFGTSSNKRILLGGHGISVVLPVISWSDVKIVVMVPANLKIVKGRTYYTGVQKYNSGWTWSSNINKSIKICQ